MMTEDAKKLDISAIRAIVPAELWLLPCNVPTKRSTENCPHMLNSNGRAGGVVDHMLELATTLERCANTSLTTGGIGIPQCR